MLKLLIAVLPKLWKVKDNREKYDNTTANSSTLFRHGLDSAKSKITFQTHHYSRVNGAHQSHVDHRQEKGNGRQENRLQFVTKRIENTEVYSNTTCFKGDVCNTLAHCCSAIENSHKAELHSQR